MIGTIYDLDEEGTTTSGSVKLVASESPCAVSASLSLPFSASPEPRLDDTASTLFLSAALICTQRFRVSVCWHTLTREHRQVGAAGNRDGSLTAYLSIDINASRLTTHDLAS